MKIIYSSNQSLDEISGGKTHFFEVAKNLISMGNELFILMPCYSDNKNKATDNLDYGNMKIILIPTFKRSAISYMLFQLLKPFYMVLLIFKYRPDVFYSRSGFDFSFIMCKLFNIGSVMEKNGVLEYEFRQRGTGELVIKIMKKAEKTIMKTSNRLVCVSHGIKEYLNKNYCLPEDKLKVIPNGVDAELFIPLKAYDCRKSLNLDVNFFYVGFVGSFTTWRKLEILIEAAKHLKRLGVKDIKFVLVGGGGEEEKLKSLAKSLDVDDMVYFYPKVKHQDVVYYINSFDVCYVYSNTYGSPVKLFEYLACGRPVIANRIDGISEIIEEGDCGIVMDDINGENLAQLVLELRDEKELLYSKGINGRKLVEKKYTWRSTANKVYSVMEEVLSK